MRTRRTAEDIFGTPNQLSFENREHETGHFVSMYLTIQSEEMLLTKQKVSAELSD